jgi:hypothetical protein
VKQILEDHIEWHGPCEKDGSKVFSTLDGTAVVEMKVDRVNKVLGFEFLVDMVLKDECKLTSVTYVGDDVAKKQYRGSDWFTMICAEQLKKKFGIPFFNIHVHHEEVEGTQFPNPSKYPSGINQTLFEVPTIDLRFPSPKSLLQFTLQVLGRKECAKRDFVEISPISCTYQ